MRRFCAAPGSFGTLQAAIGVALDALEALVIHAAAHQHVVGHVRARRRKPPVVVVARAVGPAVGVAAHDQRVRILLQDLGHLLHDDDHRRPRLGGSDREHAEVVVVGQADQHAVLVRRHVDVGDGPGQLRVACLISLSILAASCLRGLLRRRLLGAFACFARFAHLIAAPSRLAETGRSRGAGRSPRASCASPTAAGASSLDCASCGPIAGFRSASRLASAAGADGSPSVGGSAGAAGSAGSALGARAVVRLPCWLHAGIEGVAIELAAASRFPPWSAAVASRQPPPPRSSPGRRRDR